MRRVNGPIGVFDSGMGGLTVVRQLIKFLPKEDILYLGDTARVPYGNKSKKAIISFSIQNALYLLKFKVKLIVVACNTSSSFALKTLKKRFKVPIVGVIAPGAQKALELTNSGRIGIIGTNATISSNAYQKKILALNPKAKIFAQSCPLFVSLVEEGWLNGKITLDVIDKYLTPLKRKKIDTLILGCTHYPLLEEAIKKVMGKRVRIVDSATQTALSIKQLMEEENIVSSKKKKGKIRFFLTDKPYSFKKIGQRFLGQKLMHISTVKEKDYI